MAHAVIGAAVSSTQKCHQHFNVSLSELHILTHTHTLLFKGYSLTYFHVAYHLSNALLLTWINSDSQLFMKTQRVIPYCCSACYLCMYVRICDDIPNTMCRECETIVCGANLRVWEVDFKPQDKLQKYCTLDFVK